MLRFAAHISIIIPRRPLVEDSASLTVYYFYRLTSDLESVCIDGLSPEIAYIEVI